MSMTKQEPQDTASQPLLYPQEVASGELLFMLGERSWIWGSCPFSFVLVVALSIEIEFTQKSGTENKFQRHSAWVHMRYPIEVIP